MQVTDDMVSRFLCWPLPKTFAPDCGISFDGRKDDEWNKDKTWPIGTNLLTAIEARAMLEHVFATAQPSELPDGLSEKRTQTSDAQPAADMTINGGQPHAVGDRGQRYEITFFDAENKVRRVLGWSATIEGARSMASGVEHHPSWALPWITDRVPLTDEPA